MNKLTYSSDSEEDMEPRAVAARNMTIEELKSEVEMRQIYRRLLVESLRSGDENNKYKSNCYNESLVKKVSTRAVQTDPAMTSIQPSWLISVQMLVDQLHAEIGNLINSAYHQSNTWRYLKLENGCWQSTLLPNVRIPAPRDFKGVKQFTVEEMRHSLGSLHELTRKLQILIPEPMDDAYRTEMYAYMEKRGKCATEDRASDLKQVKEHIYGAVATSKSASRGKVLEVNNYLEGFNATRYHRNPHLVGLKSCSLLSQKTEANGEEAAFGKASEIWKEHASSSKDGKTVQFQEKDILVDGAALKSGLSICQEWVRVASQDIASNTQQNEVQKRQNHRSKSDLSNYGSVAGRTKSAIAESAAAGNKKKIPGDVLADCSNIPLKRESDVGNGASVRDIKNKLSAIKENKDENRPPNFIKRNILAVKNPVIQPGTSRSFVKRVVPKLSKPGKMN